MKEKQSEINNNDNVSFNKFLFVASDPGCLFNSHRISKKIKDLKCIVIFYSISKLVHFRFKMCLLHNTICRNLESLKIIQNLVHILCNLNFMSVKLSQVSDSRWKKKNRNILLY